ncbi:lysozyme inhibitor LprI family protein [Thalassotalea hakodatensis]|uniref:lysozyme inhibitor LprI family protein n=1 Tax=Thalassotalea hakodatensis TaxID=3030492 RepID=UPI00257302FA|nr:lysozyme inhibitor LprI family protein [Thalassotalea hakodatensis]
MKLIRKYTHYSLLCIASIISYQASAVNEKTIEVCEQNYNKVDELSMCFDSVKENVDKEMQTWINNQTFVLEEFSIVTGRRAALNMFKRSQRNFITYRENNCRWQYLHISPDKKAASAYKKCYILLTQSRIKELSRLN